ncbi:MAG: mannose-6-phosphate isomerase [Actinomycetota bacterium]
MRHVIGVVQHYAWGDTSAIPDLLGLPADGRPWAELWLGTHRGGPAMLEGDVSLFGVSGDLPYLLKVLAAAEPLSLQTHPTRVQAQSGYAREERDGPPVDAPNRIYRDSAPKPELICALTPFEALCGFRPPDASVELLRRIGAVELAEHLEQHGLEATVRDVYLGSFPIESTLESCRSSAALAATLVTTLATMYPGDPSVVVTLLLNRVSLAPGEAIYLGPGNLHAYLHGVGVEVMGASDNVVRGGLTPKHVDVHELLAVLDYSVLDDPRTIASERSPGVWCYETADTPFQLWRYELTGELEHTATGRELLVCVSGSTDLIGRGEVVYLAIHERIVLQGSATLFRVEER